MQYNSALYSIPYIVVFGLLWFLYLNEKGRIKNGLATRDAGNVAFFVLLIFIGLRGHLYSDFINYYDFFRNLPPIYKLNHIFQSPYEPGFIIYSSLLKTVAPNYFIWVFINTLIDLLVFRLVFKRYTHSLILPFIFFLAYQGLIIEFNLYQNAKAIDLFLLSLPYLKQRKPAHFMILNLIGASFHVSALFYLPLYFLIHREIPRWLVMSLLIVSNVVFLGNIHFTSYLVNYLGNFISEDLLDRMISYLNTDIKYGFSFGYFERTLSIVICTILYNKLIEQNSFNRILFNCALFYYLIFLMFSDVRVFAERLPLLLVFSYWILFSNIVVLRFQLRPTIMSVILIISLLKVYTGNQNVMSSYDNLLWGIKSYEERRATAEAYIKNVD